MSGAAIFGRDMMFDIPYIADWTDIGKRRQALVDQNNAIENKRRIDFDYAVGQKVLLKNMVSSARQKTRTQAFMLSHKCTQMEQSGFNAEQCQRDYTLGD